MQLAQLSKREILEVKSPAVKAMFTEKQRSQMNLALVRPVFCRKNKIFSRCGNADDGPWCFSDVGKELYQCLSDDIDNFVCLAHYLELAVIL